MSGSITPEIVAEHGLSSEEYARIVKSLGRAPNLTELGIFSVMWSEHCSYKSSRVHLKKLPTTGPHVIQGPGENAGVVDIGDGQAAIFKMESHNHPSFIEPFQGAATGVGGILRDVFTMGARPIANLNALRFGAPDHEKTRHLVSGVVAGIGFYGNCVGVPTVAGEVNFHPAYSGNILVNAMTVGLADKNRIFYSAAAGAGNPVVYVGSKTGRDGIHGATMASAEFGDGAEEKRPTVQVGDPFTEKLLIEACLELMAEDAIIAIQDMGAAGLTSSSVEMAAKGGVGIELTMDQVPQRETGMTAYEMMLSESQERMLMVLKPGREGVAEAIFKKWELDFSVIGRTTTTGHLVLKHKGGTVCDIPLKTLADESPVYERPWVAPPPPRALTADEARLKGDLGAMLVKLMASPDLCSKTWIIEQYDRTVMADQVEAPGADAALVRVHGTSKALACCVDCTPRYVKADPKEGAKQAIAEAWRNITATGATPLAVTDCLNFGNPERAEIMGEFVLAIEGMAEACKALAFPVVSGNVSLYNETNGQAILPTPGIGAIGLAQDIARTARVGLGPEEEILLVGETRGHLGQSIALREVKGLEAGAPPPVDLVAEKRNGDFVRRLIERGLARFVHDCADGGLAVAVAEMALASGRGCRLEGPAEPAHWFGEDQARYVVSAPAEAAKEIIAEARRAGVAIAKIGTVNGMAIALPGAKPLALTDLRAAHERFLPMLMGETV
ncbi:MAG: phosphoribosylformylglycinamidine synthase subunit PurL [Alphaproteobacteria bacterium]